MLSACTPVLVGVVSPVSEILLPFKNGQISMESAQKIHASRD